jgi:hypothetical protein
MARLAMSEIRPVASPKFASLGPLLLARKGTAKPAMRAQLDADSRGGNLDDLGWNDMGEDLVIAAEAQVETPAEAGKEPAVRRQQVDLQHRIADANLAAFQDADNQDCAASTANHAHRAAFTLRLDEARHLRLRLASTVQGESAQALVTRALDRLLSQMPEIEQLAAQVKRGTNKA